VRHTRPKVLYEATKRFINGLNASVHQFVERLNDLNRYLLYFPEENPKQLDQDEIIEILDQAKAPKWHEAMVNLPGKKSLAFLFEEINALKRQLKPEKTASSKKRKAESILSTEINLITSSDEGENKEYLFTSSKPFRSSKTKLEKSSHPTT
jgi:hypothetical protein